jgi:hypothetical protein
MRIPPIKGSFVSVQWEISAHNAGEAMLEVIDEGGGAFLQVRTPNDSTLRLNPAEVVALGKWAVEACRELDAHNKQAQPEAATSE